METLSKFYFDSLVLARQNKWRWGQAVFNLLAERRPDLSEKVRGTDMDIFHMMGPADNFGKWDKFAYFIATNWYPPQGCNCGGNGCGNGY